MCQVRVIFSYMTETEINIIQAAETVFLRKGLEASSMKDIATEAGISRPSLHYYHRTKHALFQAILIHAIKGFIPKLNSIITSELPLLQKVEHIIDTYMDMFLANPLLPQFFVMEMQRDSRELVSLIRKHSNVFELLPTMKTYIVKELNLDMPPEQALVHFFNTLYGLLVFPFLCRPLLDEIVFKGNNAEFRHFIKQRKPIIIAMLSTMVKTPFES